MENSLPKNKIKVSGQELSAEEFIKFSEDIQKDKTKKLKKISESEYTVLQKMQG